MKILIESEYDLNGMLWSGAEKTFEEIIDADKFDDFCQYIDNVYSDGIGLTELNDILRFDFDSLKKDIGMFDLEDEINTKALTKLMSNVTGASKIKDLSKDAIDLFDTLSDKLDEVESCDNADEFESLKDEINDIKDEIYDVIIDGEEGGDAFRKDIQKNIIDLIDDLF